MSQAVDEPSMAEQQPVIATPLASTPTALTPDSSESVSHGLTDAADTHAPVLDSSQQSHNSECALPSRAAASSSLELPAHSGSSLAISEATPLTAVPSTQVPSASTGKKKKGKGQKSQAKVSCVNSVGDMNFVC